MRRKKEEGKREPEALDLPDTVDLTAVNLAEIRLIQAAAQRRIAPYEAIYFSRMLEHRRRAIGDCTLEEKLDRAKELRKAAREKA